MVTGYVDLWALGILIYEMCTSDVPFSGPDIYRSVTSHKGKIGMPLAPPHRPTLTPDALDLINKLCKPNPQLRLGSLKGGMADVKAHPFFAEIDFAAVNSRTVHVPAAWVPHVNDPTDTSNFDTSGEDEHALTANRATNLWCGRQRLP